MVMLPVLNSVFGIGMSLINEDSVFLGLLEKLGAAPAHLTPPPNIDGRKFETTLAVFNFAAFIKREKERDDLSCAHITRICLRCHLENQPLPSQEGK